MLPLDCQHCSSATKTPLQLPAFLSNPWTNHLNLKGDISFSVPSSPYSHCHPLVWCHFSPGTSLTSASHFPAHLPAAARSILPKAQFRPEPLLGSLNLQNKDYGPELGFSVLHNGSHCFSSLSPLYAPQLPAVQGAVSYSIRNTSPFPPLLPAHLPTCQESPEQPHFHEALPPLKIHGLVCLTIHLPGHFSACWPPHWE